VPLAEVRVVLLVLVVLVVLVDPAADPEPPFPVTGEFPDPESGVSKLEAVEWRPSRPPTSY